jgi:antitoxin VapB
MALNIKDDDADRLASEIAELTDETKTRAVKTALEERRQRLARRALTPDQGERLRRFLEVEAWPQVPAELLDKPLSRAEREAILGYGPEGV